MKNSTRKCIDNGVEDDDTCKQQQPKQKIPTRWHTKVENTFEWEKLYVCTHAISYCENS